MSEPFIVPLDTPVMKYHRAPFNRYEAEQVLADRYSGRALTTIFSWAGHEASTGGWRSWQTWYNRSMTEAGFVLPEQGKTYIRWLLKGELKDNFDEKD